ncbi:MAG: hypothetical protein ACRECF_02450 [Methyloceanibacter sp.]
MVKYDEKAKRGQTIRCESSPDKSSMKMSQKEAVVGPMLKGGAKDLSHSLKGASVVSPNDMK